MVSRQLSTQSQTGLTTNRHTLVRRFVAQPSRYTSRHVHYVCRYALTCTSRRFQRRNIVETVAIYDSTHESRRHTHNGNRPVVCVVDSGVTTLYREGRGPRTDRRRMVLVVTENFLFDENSSQTSSWRRASRNLHGVVRKVCNLCIDFGAHKNFINYIKCNL